MNRTCWLFGACFVVLMIVGVCQARSGGALGSGLPRGGCNGTDSTIIVVRHANKAEGSSDPGLSEKGQGRAKRLAGMLRHSGVDTVYASTTARAQQTADIVLRQLNLGPEVLKPYDAREKSAVLAQRLIADGPGRMILVVGHSNTIPPLLKELGGWEVGEINTDEEPDFDHVFIVTLGAGGTKRLLSVGYPPVAK